MAKTTLEKEELETLKSQLKYGDITVLIERTDKSRRHIRNVLEGESEDLEMIEAITDLIDERSTKANNVKNRIKQMNP